MRRFLAAGAVLASSAIVAMTMTTLRDAEAQRIDPRRPSVLVVGAPPGPAPMQRVDARRSGLSKTALPSGQLRVGWRKSTGLSIDQAPLVGGDGSLAIVSVRGDVTFLDEAGDEKMTVKVGAAQVGPAALTSDGTVVYSTSGGEAIGVRRTSSHTRFSTRIGGERNVRAAPLALDDGGVVIATTTDLIVLDSEGNVRARVAMPERPDAPLIASGDKVIAITITGAVFGWTPGREPVRLGSFGAPLDGGAVLVDGGLLVGVIEGNHLAEVEIARGGRSTRSIAAQGLYLGPPAARAMPNGNGSATALLALTQSRGFVVTLDPSGQELVRAPVETRTPVALPDGGAPPLVAPPHVGPLVDARGTIAFASTDGAIGVVTPEGAVETIGETLCTKGIRSGVVGLSPSGPGSFAVACDGGIVAKITGRDAPSGVKQPSPAAPPGSASGNPGSLRRPGPRDPDD